MISAGYGFSFSILNRNAQVLAAILLLQLNLAQAVEPVVSSSAATATVSVQQTTGAGTPSPARKDNIPFNLLQQPSRNPFDAYRGKSVPPPSLANSTRLDSLIRDGKLYLHLQDAIDLALENNLDLVIARYNIPIAQMDVLRTSAGGSVRGVNTGVVSGTPGGAGGAFSGSSGAGVGGTSGGAGGAGAGASGLVQSTLGTGTIVNNYDPLISAKTYVDHTSQLLPNQVLYGVPVIHQNTFLGNFTYQQAFPTGGAIQMAWNNNRQTTNSPNNTLNPQLNSYFEFYANQQLLAGFGRGPNLRYLRIAKTNQKVSDVAFRAQLIATVTQICDLYWDLVNAYDNEQVGERSVAFATATLDTSRKQLALHRTRAMAAADGLDEPRGAAGCRARIVFVADHDRPVALADDDSAQTGLIFSVQPALRLSGADEEHRHDVKEPAAETQSATIHQMKVLIWPGNVSPTTEKSGTGKSPVSRSITPIICWETLGFVHRIAIVPAFSSNSAASPS